MRKVIKIMIVAIMIITTTGCNETISKQEKAEYNNLLSIKEELDYELKSSEYKDVINTYINKHRVDYDILKIALDKLVEDKKISEDLKIVLLEDEKNRRENTPIVGMDNTKNNTLDTKEYTDDEINNQLEILFSDNDNLKTGRTSVYRDIIIYKYIDVFLNHIYYTIELNDRTVVKIYANK